MKFAKRTISVLLALAMVLTILPLSVSAKQLEAMIDSFTGSATGVAYDGTNGAYALTSPSFVVKSGDKVLNYSTLIENKPLLFTNKACTSAYKLTTTPISGTDYYSYVFINLWEKDAYDLTYDDDDIEANFNFTIPGYDVKFDSLTGETSSYLEITFTVTPKMPEIKDVKLTASGLVYDSKLDSYVPNLTKTVIKDADGNTLTLDPVEHSGMYTSGSFVAANEEDDELEPGKTYYGAVKVDMYKENAYQYNIAGYNAIKDAFSLTIPGYKVEFYDLMEREMGSYLEIKYTIVREEVRIGTVTGTATGVAHDGSLGGYAITSPSFTVKDTNGNSIPGLDPVKWTALYTKASFGTDTKLTTEPVPGTTYYSAVTVDLYKENTYWLGYDLYSVFKETFSLTVPGYKVEFYDLMEREMGSYLEIKFTLIPCEHKYSNACDKSCNSCGLERTTSHSYEKKTTKATLTKDGVTKNVCKVCGYTASKTTKIYKASKISLSDSTHTYTGSVKKPSVIVKDSKGKTISSKYYTVTYASGRKNVGKYKVTVKMKGNYSGTKTLYFTISPAKTTQKTPVAAKKALTIKWTKKTAQVTGYQIQYSTTKSFKSYKTKTISKNTTTSTKLTGLKAKTTYYVRVRTYKTVNGVKYYSGWSTVKYKKTK